MMPSGFRSISVIGATTWVELRVTSSGPDLRMTGQPEDVPPLARGVIPGVEQRGLSGLSTCRPLADKVAAMISVTARDERPSTRYRDLVDLVAIVTGASVSASRSR